MLSQLKELSQTCLMPYSLPSLYLFPCNTSTHTHTRIPPTAPSHPAAPPPILPTLSLSGPPLAASPLPTLSFSAPPPSQPPLAASPLPTLSFSGPRLTRSRLSTNCFWPALEEGEGGSSRLTGTTRHKHAAGGRQAVASM